MDEELTDEERAALRALERDVPPPPELEERIATALSREGLLRRPRRAAPVAAAAVLFAAGLAVGLLVARPRAAAPSGARYVMLLESPADERSTGVQEDVRVTAIVDWARRQRAAGTKLSGEKLTDGGYAVTAAGVEALPAAPYVLGGYFIVSARDDEEATRIAASHPLVRWGGRILLRRIQEL